jgi:hypothetical protein
VLDARRGQPAEFLERLRFASDTWAADGTGTMRVRRRSSSARREAVRQPRLPIGSRGTHHEAKPKRRLLHNVVDRCRRGLHIDSNPLRHARNTMTRQNFLFLEGSQTRRAAEMTVERLV